MKIFIAGAGGMLGQAFKKIADEKKYLTKFTDKDVNEEWIEFLDFRDFIDYEKQVMDFNPDILVHLGAYTSLEYCEENVDDTYKTNTLSVEYAVQIANRLNIPIGYISTAGIFDGKKQEYDDWDQPNPLGVYARSKYMGEKYVLNNAQKYFVCRAGWMMGGGPKKDKKFVNKIMQQINSGQKEIFVVDDKDGTPTFTIDFARNFYELIETNFYGIYNMVCGGLTSRYEVSKEIIKILNKEDEIKLTPVNSEYFKDQYFAERPPCERLVNKRLNLIGLNKMRDWKICLKEYLSDYYGV